VAVMVAVSKRNGEIEVGGVNGCGDRESLGSLLFASSNYYSLFLFGRLWISLNTTIRLSF
jgi:hypothetical protein